MTSTQKLTISLVLITSFLTFSCRKGEEDPAFSLSSRKARFAADWRMQAGYAAFTLNLTDPPLKYNETWTFDGSSFNLNSTESGVPTTYIGKYLLNINVRKDGTFDFNELFLGKPLDCSGTWCFTNGEGEEKNKERAVFTITDIRSGRTRSGFFNQGSTDFRYNIVRLANKELKIRAVGNRALAQGKQSIASITDYTFLSDEN